MDIIMIGRAGEDGILQVFKEHEKEITGIYPERYVGEGLRALEAEFADDQCMKILDRSGADVFVVGKQGIFGALYKMGQTLRMGMKIMLKAVPVRQFTIELADRYDLNPYLISSLGCILAASADGAHLVSLLNEAGYPACLIGHTTVEKACIAITETGQTFLGP